jgi:hypothetical protein
MPPKKSHSALRTVSAILSTFLLLTILAPQPAPAQTFKVLHTFHGKDGGHPAGVLVMDASENLYGTAAIGGSEKCKFGCGTVFELNNSGKPIWQHNFDEKDGYGPNCWFTPRPIWELVRYYCVWRD